MMLYELGKTIIILGVVLTVIGAVLWALGKLPFLGNLPGDILIKRENFSIYAPITTMILLSIAFSIILTIISNLKK